MLQFKVIQFYIIPNFKLMKEQVKQQQEGASAHGNISKNNQLSKVFI